MQTAPPLLDPEPAPCFWIVSEFTGFLSQAALWKQTVAVFSGNNGRRPSGTLSMEREGVPTPAAHVAVMPDVWV